MTDKGDFTVADASLTAAKRIHNDRTTAAEALDESLRAPVTTSIDAYRDDPDGLDFPGVDTPQENPRVLPKDLKDTAPTKTRADVSGDVPTDILAAGGGVDREVRDQELAEQGVPASRDEVDIGTGATSGRELGFTPQAGERRPSEETAGPFADDDAEPPINDISPVFEF